MRKSVFIYLVLYIHIPLLQMANGLPSKWTCNNPFEQKVFIENKGQYNLHEEGLNDEILFSANQDGLEYYFTKNAIWVKHSLGQKRSEREIEKLKEKLGIKKEEHEGKEEKELAIKIVNQFHVIEFVSAGNNTTIESEGPVSQLYNFGIQTNKTISAKAYKKITYKNLYPGIDMEFYFPEDKQGFKYSFILALNANSNQIQMRFPEMEKIKLDEQGNLIVTSAFGNFIDHAPSVKDLLGKTINCSFKLKKNIVTFNMPTATNSNGLIIDPWTTTPIFTGGNKAFDVDWDNAGNCYAYGGSPPFKLIKFNNTGVQQWVYTTTFSGILNGNIYYGDFAVDKNSESVYIVEGVNANTGANVQKINQSGLLVASFLGNPNFYEMWRIGFSRCTNQAVIAGGGWTNIPYTAAYLDSNLTGISPVNVLNTTNLQHDMWGLALDDAGNCYMGTAQSYPNPSFFNNILLKLPLPALTPTTWSVSTGYLFNEVASISYYTNNFSGFPYYSNGLNGIATSNSYVYTYDSYVLKKWDVATGTLANSLNVNGASQSTMSHGGISSDKCNNIFLGLNKSVVQYDGTMASVNTIPTIGTVYDVNLANNNSTLYVCGDGFVSSFQVSLPVCNNNLQATTQVNNPSCGSTNNTATVSITGGVPPYLVTWNTNPVQTSTIAVNLIAGTYVVTVADKSCPPLITSNTVVIPSAPSSFSLTTTTQSINCFGANNGSAFVNVTGGAGPFSILWSNAQTGAKDSLLPIGTYTVHVTDLTTQCLDSAIASITQPQQLNVSVTNGVICSGQTFTLNATTTGGIIPYTYSWNNGASTANPFIVSPAATSTYTVLVTDANGCKATDSLITLTVYPPPQITIGDTGICAGNQATLTALAIGGVGIYSYTWMPGNLSGSSISVSPTGTTVYTVTLNDFCATSPVTDTGIVYVVPAPIISMPNSVSGCAPLCVSFTNAAGLINWQWNFNDGITSTVKNPIHCYTTSGSFHPSITYTTTTGCISKTTCTNTITVFAISHTQFIASPNPTNILNPEVFFTNQFVSSNNWQWTFGDGTSSPNQNPSHIYAQPGTYTVMLIGKNQQGCNDTVTEQIIINDIFTFYAPGAFTPNGDILNEKFLPIGEGWDNATYKLWIYDRWGNLIFKTQDPYKGWDGKINEKGGITQEDVYVWKVQLNDVLKKTHQFTSIITLIK